MRLKLLAVLIAAIALAGEVWAWADFDYQYRRSITIDSGGASNLTDYQLNVTVDTASLISAGKLNSDCSDIRFYDDDDTTKLPYYLESGSCNATNTTFWVKLSDNGTQIYMYYGDPSAVSESNGSAAFEFFDDFEGTAVDSSKWDSAGVDVANSIATIADSTDYLISLNTFGAGLISEYYVRVNTYDSGTIAGFHDTANDVGVVATSESAMVYIYNTADLNSWTSDAAGNTENYLLGNGLAGWQRYKIAWGDTSIKFYINDSLVSEHTTVLPPSNLPINIQPAGTAVPAYDLDWVRVRKYANPEPSASVGVEETNQLTITLIEPADGATSVSSYVNFTAYVETRNNTLANLTLNVGSYSWVNETPLTNATNYTFENRYLPIDTYTWNMTLCDVTGYCLTSPSRTLTITGANITIELRDEDTDELIVNETATVAIYKASDLSLVGTYNTTTGTVNITLISPIDYVIVGWTDTSYTNQRRISFLTTEEVTQTATIYLLQDGRGSINYFDVTSGGAPLQGAVVKITWSNKTIDYGVTDSSGKFISYLDPYKIYIVNASKAGYNSTSMQFYGTSLTVHEITLDLSAITTEEGITVRFLPNKQEIAQNETAYLFIEIENWQQVDNVTVLVFDDINWIKAYEDYGITEPGHSAAYFFDLNNTDTSWCNASILCTGDMTKVRWRVMPTPLNLFGSTNHVGAIAYIYTTDGELIKAERAGWILKVFRKIKSFLQSFSDEQRHFMGLILVVMVTGAAAAEFRLSFRQAGWVALAAMVGVTAVGFWEAKFLVAPALMFIALIAWRETG